MHQTWDESSWRIIMIMALKIIHHKVNTVKGLKPRMKKIAPVWIIHYNISLFKFPQFSNEFVHVSNHFTYFLRWGTNRLNMRHLMAIFQSLSHMILIQEGITSQPRIPGLHFYTLYNIRLHTGGSANAKICSTNFHIF